MTLHAQLLPRWSPPRPNLDEEAAGQPGAQFAPRAGWGACCVPSPALRTPWPLRIDLMPRFASFPLFTVGGWVGREADHTDAEFM